MRACGLAAVFAALLSIFPLVIAPGIQPSRVVTFLILASASAALAWLGWSRTERIELARRPDGLQWGRELLPEPACLALSGAANEEPPLYRAVMGWADGSERVVLERSEPGSVLREAFTAARVLEVELRPGWGLEQHFSQDDFARAWERASTEPSGGAARAAPVDLTLWPVQRKTAAICVAAGVFVPVVTAFLARSPYRSVSPSALELWLTGLSSAAGIALGVLFFALRRRVALEDGRFLSTLVLFGRPIGSGVDLGAAPVRVFSVAPDGAFARHVLFAMPEGPVSVPADPEGAERLVRGVDTVAPEPLAASPRVTSRRYPRPDRPARLRS
jgi:hypothetical protein